MDIEPEVSVIIILAEGRGIEPHPVVLTERSAFEAVLASLANLASELLESIVDFCVTIWT